MLLYRHLMSTELSKVELPEIVSATSSALAQVTSALGVPREILASDEEIAHAWTELPRLLDQIPIEIRSEHHARMCVAVAAGLFDAAINYVWNSAILELRNKIHRFGLTVVEQFTKKDFDEDKLNDLQDSELLNLCLKLNLISEDAFFFLDQCRDTRNNFSTAHPPMGTVDDYEFIIFLKRCAKYALSETSNPTGVDTRALISSLKTARFSSEQTKEWCKRITKTHDAQRNLIFSSLHGIYCDASSSEESRLNALDVCKESSSYFSPKTRSQLLNRHSDYVASGKSGQQIASQDFFEKLDIMMLLSNAEHHAMISKACSKLTSVHLAMYNFYNEPPFAERLREITAQIAVPSSCQQEYVSTVMLCAVGNQYGVSDAAFNDYCVMISSFSPQELAIVFKLAKGRTNLGQRIRTHQRCKKQFQKILTKYIDSASIPTSGKSEYDYWVTST